MASHLLGAPLAAAATLLLLSACGSDTGPSTSAAAQSPAGATASPGAAATAPATACVTASPAPASAADRFTDTVTLTKLADGLQVGDFTVGTGPTPTKGANITVQYTGWLSDGTMFDSSRQAGRTPFSFAVGTGAVIPGWDEGLLTMHVGGKRRLVIPPALGYGAQANGPIPANSTLVFDVTLLSIGSGCPAAG